jgi:hypothetical protein
MAANMTKRQNVTHENSARFGIGWLITASPPELKQKISMFRSTSLYSQRHSSKYHYGIQRFVTLLEWVAV